MKIKKLWGIPIFTVLALILSLIGTISVPQGTVMANGITVLRSLPDNALPGSVIDVTITFTAPADNFKSLGIHDEAPDNWPVQVNADWCTPAPFTSKIVDNDIAEYTWMGPYTSATHFTAVYKVTVPVDTTQGTYGFLDGSKLTYYIGTTKYTAVVTGDAQVTVPDTTPPQVTSTTPIDDATGIARNTTVRAFFNEAIDAATINTSSFTLAGSAVAGTVTCAADNRSATFTPNAPLQYNHTYTATLTAAITDIAGNHLAPYTWSFTTAANTPPVLSDGQVNPTEGYNDIGYTYSVVYTDAENDPPTPITVTISSIEHDTYAMNPLDPGDTDYTDGNVYQYTAVMLTQGTHTFQFSASDGTDDATGDTDEHSGPTILNRLPVVAGVNITPDPAYTDTDLTATPTGWADPDGDAEDYQWQWRKWDIPIAGADTDTLDSSNFVKGDIITVICTPFDGIDTGVPVEDIISIFNTPPVLCDGEVEPEESDTETAFTYTVTYTDIDNDAPVAITVTISSEVGNVYEMLPVDPGDTDYTDGRLYYYTQEGLARGSHVFQFAANDSDDDATGDIEPHGGPAIENTAPLLTEGSVTPNSGDVTTEFTYTVKYMDADGDMPVSITVSIGSPAAVAYLMTEQDTGDTDCTDGKIYEHKIAGLAKGEHTFQFAASDGTDDATGDIDIHHEPIVINTPPTQLEVDIMPDEPTADVDLMCLVTTPSIDADGDAITYTYEWYKDGELQPDETTTTMGVMDFLSAALTERGEVWKCVVTPNDDEEDGPSAEDAVLILGAPIVTITSPADAWSVTNNALLTIEGTIDALPPVDEAIVILNGVEQPPADVIGGVFSYDINLTEGPNTIIIIANNIIGAGYADIFVTLDTTPPEIYGLTDDTIPTRAKTWRWDSWEAATYRYSINQDEHVAPTGAYSNIKTATLGPGASIDGTWYIHVQARDEAGNESPVYTVFATLDNTPPTATLSNTPPDPTNATTASILVGGTDILFYKYSLDNPNKYGGKIPVANPIVLSGLAQGRHTLYVLGQDSSGNWQSKSLVGSPTIFSWTVDTTAPVVTITSPANGLVTNNANLTVTGSVSDNTVATVILTLRGVNLPEIPVTAGGFTQDITLVEGANTISASATDAAGNTGASAVITVTLDTNAPTVAITSPQDGFITNNALQTITGTVSDRTITRATLTLNGANTTITVTVGTFSRAINLIEGENQIQVSANDTAGNIGTSALIKVTLDITAPTAVLTGVPTGTVNYNTANITVGGTGIDSYKYRMEDEIFSDDWVPIATPITLTDLIDGPQIIYVLGRNEETEPYTEQAEASPTTATWTVDTIAPVIAITSHNNLFTVNRASQVISGTIDDTDITTATLRLNGVVKAPAVTVTNGNFYYPVTLQSASITPNTVNITASDAAGNTGSVQITIILNTNAPTLISLANGTSTTDNTPAFTWGAVSGASRYHVQIASNNGFTQNLLENNALATTNYTATALADGTWYWRVRWSDNCANWCGYSATWSFTLSTQPPVVTITSPANAAVLTAASQNVTGTVTAATDISSVTLTLNGVSQTIPVTAGSFNTAITLRPGTNTIAVSASNMVGTQTAGPITVTYVTKPVVQITSPADGSIFSNRIQIVRGTISPVTGPPTFAIYLNGIQQAAAVTLNPDGTFVSGNITLREGANTIHVVANNPAGSGSSNTLTVRVDTSAPIINLTSPTAGLVTNNSTQTVIGTINELAITTATLKLNGVSRAISVVSGNFTQGITLAEGRNTIEVTAADVLGNTGSSGIRTVILDTRPPIVSITAPMDGSVTNNDNPLVTGTIDDTAITTANIVLNSVLVAMPVTGGFFSQGVTLNSNATNTITVSATDAAGNTGRSSIVVTHSGARPMVSITSPASGQTTGNAQISVTGNVSSPVPITSTRLIVNGVSQTIELTGGQFGQNINLSPGVNRIEVTATNTANNTGSSGIRTITLDTTPPRVVITSPREGALLGTNTVTVTGTIDDLAITTATLTLNGVGSPVEVTTGAFSKEITLNSANNTATTNAISVSAQDAYGNRGNSSTLVLKVDTRKPGVTITSPVSGLITRNNTLAVSGTVDDPAIAQVTLVVNGTSNNITVTGQRFGTTITLRERANTILAKATNAAGNTGSSGVITVTLDTTPPVVTLTSPANGLVVNTNSIVLSGTVDDPTVNNVIVTGNVTSNDQAQIIPVQGGAFSRTITLTANVAYIISVSAMDSVGNQSAPVTRTVTRDTDRPMVTITSPVDGSRTNIASQQVVATVTHDRAIASVELSLNGGARQSMAEVASYAANVTLTSGNNTIEVFATDDIGNQGSSGVITVILDTAAPTLTIGLSDPTDSVLITVTSDEALQSPPAVSVNGTAVGNTPIPSTTIDMTLAGVNRWTGTYPRTGVLAEGSYAVSITGIDLAGNQATSQANFSKETVTIAADETGVVTTDTATVEINTTVGVEDASISVTQYAENPAENTEGGEEVAGVFVEIIASAELRDAIDPDEGVHICIDIDVAALTAQGIDISTLRLYLWNVETGQWEEVEGSGVTDSRLCGTVYHLSTFGAFGEAITQPAPPAPQPPSGGGGGGGGGGGAAGYLPLYDIVSDDGMFNRYAMLKSEDEKCVLTIERGTIARNADGTVPLLLSILPPSTTPPVPENTNIISLVYELSPSGLTLDPPVTLTITYDPDDIPAEVDPADLVIAYYDTTTGSWVVLDDIVVDQVTHKISAKVSHFTPFAVIAYNAPASFATSNLVITPAEVVLGEASTITVTVANSGDLSGTYDVVLKINNIPVETKSVTLDGKTSMDVTFSITQTTVGTYTIDIDTLSGTLEVNTPTTPAPTTPAPTTTTPSPTTPAPTTPAPATPAPTTPAPTTPAPTTPSPTPTGTNWWVIGGSIIAAVIIVAIAAWMLLVRRKK